MILYPVKKVTDSRGTKSKTPDLDNPFHLRVNCSTDRQSTAELPGQVDVKVLKVIAPFNTPVDSWGRAYFRGEYWDLPIPPSISNFTKATRHVEFLLRSRNRVIE